ncbi:MAG: ATP-binding cassette domain-containing protein [Bacteroidetes bacterium]|jgi:ABC-type bacteriocin/lantibiotic exporter with double-glycine peptidase domain|nr:ATP-binding cassette domain-containing protein [Bacteroidota bacterium]
MDNKLTAVQRLFRLASLDKRDLGVVYIYAFLSGIIYLSVPLGIQSIINLLQAGNTNQAWILMVLIVLGGILVSGLLQVFQLSLVETLQQRIFVRSSYELSYRIPKVNWDQMSKKYLPEQVNRFFDTMIIQKGLSKILFDVSSAIIQIILGLLLLAFYHPFFIGFGFVLVFLFVLIFWFTGPKGLGTSLDESTHKYNVAFWLEELARTNGIFKMNPFSTLPHRRTNHLVNHYLTSRKSHFRILLTQYYSMVGFKVVVAAGLLILGGILVFQQQMTLGQFVAAEIIILLIVTSVEKLMLNVDVIYDILTSIEKIGQVTDMTLERHEGRILDVSGKPKGLSVDVKDFKLLSSSGEFLILDGLNLNIASGERIGIIGPPGSGKSSFLHSISGFFDSYDGQIVFNGSQPLGSLRIDSLRDKIGFNFTEDKIFNGTIFENISAGGEVLTTPKCQKIIDIVGLREFVNGQEKGLDTEISPMGEKVSGTVRKKIVLARAMSSQPKLLLFEDHIQSIPAYERTKIYDHLVDKETNFTLIAISMNKELLRRCDRVIVFKEGKIFAQGPFENLITDPQIKSFIDA